MALVSLHTPRRRKTGRENEEVIAVSAGKCQPNRMTRAEKIRSRDQIEDEFINLPGYHRCRVGSFARPPRGRPAVGGAVTELSVNAS